MKALRLFAERKPGKSRFPCPLGHPDYFNVRVATLWHGSRLLPFLAVPGSYLRRTRVASCSDFVAKSEHEATLVLGWYDDGTGLIPNYPCVEGGSIYFKGRSDAAHRIVHMGFAAVFL